MPEISDLLTTSAHVVASLGRAAGLSDSDLLAAQTPLATLQKQLDAIKAEHAGEIARRSDRIFGHSGLAQRNGFHNATQMLEATSGISGVEATKLVSVGTLMAALSPASPPDSGAADDAPTLATSPHLWRDLVATAVRLGDLTVDAASAIVRGLNGIDDRVAAVDISGAARSLATRASQFPPDALFREARAERDRLDASGIAEREDARREDRYFSIRQQPDGMFTGSFRLAPEEGSLVNAAFDAALSPRRGGPRFVDKAWKARAQKLIDDPRTNAQIAADVFAELIRIAIDADPNTPLGSRRPAVRVTVREDMLVARAGFGEIDGNPDPVSFETVARHICDTGIIGVKFDHNGERIVNIGRTQRLFTERQRTGLGVRDRGCRYPGCDRPPSWAEAHHINEWEADKGKTNIDDGILLCRQHHMLVHNNDWKILREDGTYWLRPPASIDPAQELIEMPPASPRIMRVIP